MFKKAVLLFLVIIAAASAKAQTADEVYDAYLDFNLARLQSESGKALELGEDLLANVAKLTDGARINFYYSLGNLYENDKQSGKALSYYEKVAAAVPDYYVVQRALGYMYLKDCEGLADKLNAAKTNIVENKRLTILYAAAVKKTLPHLEKAQACDPNPETLSLIKMLYKNIKDTAGLSTLESRLSTLSKKCIDLLPDK